MKRYLLFACISLFLAGCFGTEPQKTGLEGKPLPQFSLLLPDSTTWFHSASIQKGTPLAIFYFNPYCPHCKEQTNEIIDDMDKLKDVKFYFVTNFPFPDMKKFVNDYKLEKFPNITTGNDSAGLVGNYFEIVGVPYMAIYGRDQLLNKTFLGKIYSSQIKKVAEE